MYFFTSTFNFVLVRLAKLTNPLKKLLVSDWQTSANTSVQYQSVQLVLELA